MSEATSQPSAIPRDDRRRPGIGRDEGQACLQRARSILGNPGVVLPWLFGLVLGTAYALTGSGDAVDWALAGGLAALALVVVGGGNLKFWVVLYPLIFLGPRFQLGGWSDQGEKLFGLQLYEPWILLLLVLWVPRLLATKRLELSWTIKPALGVLFCLGLVAVWIAPDRMSALKGGSRTFFEPLLLFALITSLSWRRSELRWATLILVGVGMVVAGASLVEYAAGARQQPTLARLDASWEGSNVEAAFLGAVIPVALGWVLSASSRMGRLTGLAALFVSSAAMVLTFSRGAWIAATLAVALQTRWARAWVWAALAGLLLVVGALLAPPEVLERALSIGHFEQDPSASNRLALWPQVLRLIEDRPLTGYGIASFPVLFMLHVGGSYHAHNIFLDFAVTLGVPALVVFLWLVARVLARAMATFRRVGRSEDGLLLLGLWTGNLSILTAGVFDGSILIWAILAHTFWFVLALTYATAVAVERERPPRAGPATPANA